MTHKLSPSRCATAAIAAALATLPPAAMAQDSATMAAPPSAVTIAPPPVVPPPQIVLPTARTAPTVQPLPQPSIASAVPAEAAPTQALRRVAPERTNAPVRRRAPAALTAAPAAAIAATAMVPIATPVVPSSAPSAIVAAAPPVVSPTQPISPVAQPAISPLELGLIGSAFAVVGLGVVALFMRRRRDMIDDGHDGGMPATRDTMVDMPAVVAPRATVHPLASAQRGGTRVSDNHADMVDAGPTVANPFLTRKNRLRRARFLDRQLQRQRDQDARALAGQRLMPSPQRAPERAYPQPAAAAD